MTEEKTELPKKFRVVAKPVTDAEKLVVEESDANQNEWKFTANDTPKSREQSKALVTIEAFENSLANDGLNDDQKDQLAEAYASIGEYKKAIKTAVNERAKLGYNRILTAINVDDQDWCEHGIKHQFIKDLVWSKKHGCEMNLIACNVCGTWNVTETPQELLNARLRRANFREQASGKTIEEQRQILRTL